MKKKYFCILLILVLTTETIFPQASMDDYRRGLEDGKRDGKGNFMWFFAGLCLGGTGFFGAFFLKPDPPAEALLGKSPEYCIGYTEGYKDKASKENIMYAGAGCLTFWTAYCIIYVLALSSSTYSY